MLGYAWGGNEMTVTVWHHYWCYVALCTFSDFDASLGYKNAVTLVLVFFLRFHCFFVATVAIPIAAGAFFFTLTRSQSIDYNASNTGSHQADYTLPPIRDVALFIVIV